MKIRYSILTWSDSIKEFSLIAWTQKQSIRELCQACHWLRVCALILRKNILSSRISWIILKIHQSFYLPSVLCVTEVSKPYLMDQICLTTHCDDHFYWCVAMPIRPWRQTGAADWTVYKDKFAILPFNNNNKFMIFLCHSQHSFPLLLNLPYTQIMCSPRPRSLCFSFFIKC